MEEDEFLENEKLKKILSPHPLSFMNYQSIPLFLLVWGVVVGWLINFSEYSNLLNSNSWFPMLLWGIVILIAGVVVSLLTIRWSIFFMNLAIFIVGIVLILWQGWQDIAGLFLPFYTIGISLMGFLMVEWFRRSHQYIITNLRIIFRGGVTAKEERALRYSKVSDINSKQGVLGQIFGFGTITPISDSGFGLGSDSSFAAGGIGAGKKKVGLFGLFGGGKEVSTPRSRSYYELHGVHPYKEINKLVQRLVQKSDISPYQQEQVSFQKEQVDVQKQMRDLLKKQQDLESEKEQ
ncbi:MAG: PH domain-containing protein [Candidatus Thermoplasmatota archaeon]